MAGLVSETLVCAAAPTVLLTDTTDARSTAIRDSMVMAGDTVVGVTADGDLAMATTIPTTIRPDIPIPIITTTTMRHVLLTLRRNRR